MKLVAVYLSVSALQYLFQFIDRLRGLDGDLEEAQYPSHDVDDGVRDLSRGADVTDVSTGVVKREGFDELASDALGELRGGVKAVFPPEAIELPEI